MLSGRRTRPAWLWSRSGASFSCPVMCEHGGIKVLQSPRHYRSKRFVCGIKERFKVERDDSRYRRVEDRQRVVAVGLDVDGRLDLSRMRLMTGNQWGNFSVISRTSASPVLS